MLDTTRKHVHVLCHRATQLLSGSMTAIAPSKWVVVHDWMRSGYPFIWAHDARLSGIFAQGKAKETHLHKLLAIWTAMFPEVGRSLDDRAE